MQNEWINIDLNVIGIIKQLLTLFLGYMMFGKCRRCIVNPWLLLNVTLELRSRVTLVPRVNNTPLALSKHHVILETVNN